MKTLRNKRVLVTGGARGIGLALARSFAAEGAEIVLADLDATQLEGARSLLQEDGGRCSVFTLDITNTGAIADVRDDIHDAVGPIEILVNNAGVVFGGAFQEVPLERHLQTFRVNVEGLVAVTHVFLPDLVAAEEAHLVNIASASGLIGLPWGTTYASSKWAAIGFSESIRLELLELGHRHVGVTTVCPSYVSTGMFEGVKPPLLTPFLKPEKLAARVARAVRRNEIFVLEPWMVKLTPFLKGVLPRALTDGLADLLGATVGMKTWQGHGGESRRP
jgi:short-subunit dehydrogenase